MDDHLFVYGTLLKNHPIHETFMASSHCIGRATFQGRLYRIDDYPGVVTSPDPSDQVHGEIYRLRDPKRLFPELDRYEECGPGFPSPTEYIRAQKHVTLETGATCKAWIYLYNLPVDGLKRIMSGTFEHF